MSLASYVPHHVPASSFQRVRELQMHLLHWHADRLPTPGRPLRVLLHGYMDLGASFQFLVDAMAEGVPTVAPDWRGYGHTRLGGAVDAFWFLDHLGDLDALLRTLSPDAPVDLIGHSMGGNVAMSYAGVQPRRVRRIVNLEGFGLPDVPPQQAPARVAKWLDELRRPMVLKDYASQAEVAERLQRQNPRLGAARASWLAGAWAAPDADGRWRLRANPAHKRIHPVPYRAEEALAMWRAITAPVLWLQGRASRPELFWGERHTQADVDARLGEVRQLQKVWIEDAGHMLHHDQPRAVAQAIEAFLA